MGIKTGKIKDKMCSYRMNMNKQIKKCQEGYYSHSLNNIEIYND